jgi:hypothetical protein
MLQSPMGMNGIYGGMGGYGGYWHENKKSKLFM